jgi:hypothetical protein
MRMTAADLRPFDLRLVQLLLLSDERRCDPDAHRKT